MLGTFMLGSLAACSSSNSTSSGSSAAPTTTAGGGSTTTKAGGGSATTSKGGKASTAGTAPKVTRPANVEKVDKSKLPSKAQKADSKLSGLSSDESDCIDFVVVTSIESDPEMATSDEQLAGLVGASIVACVPQATIASGLTEALKSVDSSITDTQASCIQGDIAAAEPDSLAILIGAIVIEEPTILKAVGAALNDKCGTNL